MKSETVTLEKNGGWKILKEGTNKRGSWKLYGLLDEYDDVWGSWFNDSSIRKTVEESAGGALAVEFEPDGDYRKIQSIRLPGQEPEKSEAPQGDASPSRSKETAARLRLSQTAWLSAATMAKADLGLDAAKRLAAEIYADLLKKNGLYTDDDIPF